MCPVLSIFIPSYSRAEYLRGLVIALMTQSMPYKEAEIEIVVSDNVSRDHTQDMLESLSKAYPRLKVVRPEIHLPSAEENLAFGVQHCSGTFLWMIGDDDEVLPGAVDTIMQMLAADDTDCLIFNPATISDSGTLTRNALLKMHTEVIRQPIERLVGTIGFMGLSACITAFVIRRQRFISSDFASHIERARVYSHVIMLLEGLKGAQCALFNKPIVMARQGATSIEDFGRLAKLTGKPVYWPWAIGLPRHLAYLIAAGAVDADFPARALEPNDAGTLRLLGYIQSAVCDHIASMMDVRTPEFYLDPSDIDCLARIVGIAPLEDREVMREIIELIQVVQSVLGAKHALNAGPALGLVPPAVRDQLTRAMRFALRGDWGDLLSKPAPTVRAIARRLSRQGASNLLSEAGRSAIASDDTAFMTIAEWLDGLPAGHKHRFIGVIETYVQSRLQQIRSRIRIRVLPAAGAKPPVANSGFDILPCGLVYIAIPRWRGLTELELRALSYIDPVVNSPDICIAASRAELQEQIDIFAANSDEPVFDEVFYGHRIGHKGWQIVARPAEEKTAKSDLYFEGTRNEFRRLILEQDRTRDARVNQLDQAQAHLSLQDEPPPIPVFEEGWYSRRYPLIAEGIVQGYWTSGFHHWRQLGSKLHYSPSVWFDAEWYVATYPGIVEQIEAGKYPSAYDHYVDAGAKQCYWPNSLFDAEFYLATYPDAARAFEQGTDPLAHFLSTGLQAGYDISPLFNSHAYIAANGDVKAAIKAGHFISPLRHYLEYGKAEGRPLPGRKRN